MQPVTIRQGHSPIILGMPHSGMFVPDELFDRLNPLGQTLADADWHIPTLYDGLLADATIVQANFHRYVIDANRDPADVSLYPDQNTTSLCTHTSFDGVPIWREGAEPQPHETAPRRLAFHTPYHAALEAQMQRIHAQHGIALLYDCHSIRSVAPYLFEGTLPDLNIGNNSGATCDAQFVKTAEHLCTAQSRYSHVVNGRFKGGWTTRHYGRPAQGWHAIQMEICQSTYLASESLPFAYDAAKAEPLRELLQTILHQLEESAYAIASHRQTRP